LGKIIIFVRVVAVLVVLEFSLDFRVVFDILYLSNQMKKNPDISPHISIQKKIPDISRTFNFPDISLTPGHPGFGENCDNGMI